MVKQKKSIGLKIGAVAVASALIGAGAAGLYINNQANAQELTLNLQHAQELSALQNSLAQAEGSLAEAQGSLAEEQSKMETANGQIASLQVVEQDQADTITRLNLVLEDLKASAEQVLQSSGQDWSKILDRELGDNVGNVILDDSDVEGLFNGDIDFNGDSFRVKERITISPDVKIQVSALNGDKDFAENPYLVTTARDSIEYSYNFLDGIQTSDISDDESLDISFLGEDIEIVDATSSSVTIRSGKEHLLSEGETYAEDGLELNVMLVSDGNNKVMFNVNGKTKTINEGNSHKFGDWDVLVQEVLDNENQDGTDMVVVRVSNGDVLRTISDGDYVDSEGDDREWKYIVETSSGKLTKLGVKHNQISNEISDDYPAYAPGQSLNLPNDFAEIGFFVNDQPTDRVELSFDEWGDSDTPCLQISGDNLEVAGEDVDEVCYDGSLSYYRIDGDDVNSTSLPKWVGGDDIFNFAFNSSNNKLSFGGYDVVVNSSFKFFGAEEETAEASELSFDGTNLGLRDDSVLSDYGIVVVNPNDALDNDELEYRVPQSKVDAEVRIRKN